VRNLKQKTLSIQVHAQSGTKIYCLHNTHEVPDCVPHPNIIGLEQKGDILSPDPNPGIPKAATCFCKMVLRFAAHPLPPSLTNYKVCTHFKISNHRNIVFVIEFTSFNNNRHLYCSFLQNQ